MNIQQHIDQFSSLYYALKRMEKEQMLQAEADQSIPTQSRQQQPQASEAPYGVYEVGAGVVRKVENLPLDTSSYAYAGSACSRV